MRCQPGVTFGVQGALTGVAGVAHANDEPRAGLFLLRSARRPEAEGATVRGGCGVLLLAAVGRLLSIRHVGAPHALFRFLTGLEFAIPMVVVPWQARVSRTARTNL